MLTRDLVETLNEARSRMPREAWQQLAARLATLPGCPDPGSTRDATTGLPNRDAAWLLADSFSKNHGAQWSEIAAAMMAADFVLGDGASRTEIIWTGPSNGRFPVRRVDQMLYDLISSARKRIVLVTFAAHRVPHLCERLAEAVKRGVELILILESEGESEGQLTKDAATAFKSIPPAHMRIYYWPLAKRDRNQSGRPAKLHVKCAILDDSALIGSANLTDDAFNRNMELGILLRDLATVLAIHDHFQELIRRGVLVEVKSANL